MHKQGNASRRSGSESSVSIPASLTVLCPIIRAACLFTDPGGPNLRVTAAVLYPSCSLHHVPGPSSTCALARLGRGVSAHDRASQLGSESCVPWVDSGPGQSCQLVQAMAVAAGPAMRRPRPACQSDYDERAIGKLSGPGLPSPMPAPTRPAVPGPSASLVRHEGREAHPWGAVGATSRPEAASRARRHRAAESESPRAVSTPAPARGMLMQRARAVHPKHAAQARVRGCTLPTQKVRARGWAGRGPLGRAKRRAMCRVESRAIAMHGCTHPRRPSSPRHLASDAPRPVVVTRSGPEVTRMAEPSEEMP